MHASKHSIEVNIYMKHIPCHMHAEDIYIYIYTHHLFNKSNNIWNNNVYFLLRKTWAYSMQACLQDA